MGIKTRTEDEKKYQQPRRSTQPEDVYFGKSKQDMLEGDPHKRKKNKLKIQSPSNRSGGINTDSSFSINAKFSPATPKHNIDDFENYKTNIREDDP